MLRNLIKWATISATAPAEAQQFAVQKVTYQGKVADSAVLFPYGLHANLPAGSLGLLFSVNGESDNRAMIGFDSKNRPQLLENETAFYHPPTGSYIKWTQAGDLDIQVGESGGGNVTINCANATVTASAGITLDAPTITATGDIDVGGNLGVTGETALGAVVTSGGVNISGTHTHIGSPTAPVGPVTPTGIPV